MNSFVDATNLKGTRTHARPVEVFEQVASGTLQAQCQSKFIWVSKDRLPVMLMSPSQRLSLRQNLLSSLVLDDGSMPIGELSELEELDLYDNRLPSVKGLKGLKKLKFVQPYTTCVC